MSVWLTLPSEIGVGHSGWGYRGVWGMMAWPWFAKSLIEPYDTAYCSGVGHSSVRNQRILYEMIFGEVSYSMEGVL